MVKYLVEVFNEKRRFDEALLIRKVRLTRKVYNHNSFFQEMPKNTTKDDAEAKKSSSDCLRVETTEEKKSVSTSKAELEVPLLDTEETHYFTQVVDLAWEDHKPPTSRGDQRLNYLRMAYMVRKMIKQSRKTK